MGNIRKGLVLGTLIGMIAVLPSQYSQNTVNALHPAAAKSGVNVLVGEVDGKEVLPDDTAFPSSADAVFSEEDISKDQAAAAAESASTPEPVSDVEAVSGPENVSQPEAVSEPETTSGAEPVTEPDTVNGGIIPDEGGASTDQPEEVASVPDAVSSPEEPESSAEAVTVRLGFAGDINFDEDWPTTQYMDREGGIEAVFSGDLIELMRGFDIFMLNNEFTYSTRGEKTDKSYNFRADPSRVENLHVLGTDIVLLANNHVFDYGEDALLDTLDTLENAGIPYVGAGRNREEAGRPYYFTINGRKIAYVAASSAEEYTASIATRAATETECGIFDCYHQDAFIRVIKEAAESADYVIASVHWGMEYEEQYYDEQREFAVDMVNAGADAIIGTHTHCLQGVNMIDGKPVFYSLGNFWFNELDLYTGLAELTLSVPADTAKPVSLVSTRFYPCTQYDLYTEIPDDAGKRTEILRYLEDISDDSLSIDNDGYIHPAG